MHTRKMENKELTELILKCQWFVVFAFCVWFGVKANDRYQKIRDRENYRRTGEEPPRDRTDITSKLYVSFFVCALVHGYYEWKGYNPDREWIFLLSASFLHYHIATFLIYKVWPLIQASIAGGKKND